MAERNVSQDGRIEDVPMRPICTLAVPPGLEHDAKQRLARQISNTIGEACGREVEEIRLPSGTKIYNNWVLTFFCCPTARASPPTRVSRPSTTSGSGTPTS
jgi:hypothetical protein